MDKEKPHSALDMNELRRIAAALRGDGWDARIFRRDDGRCYLVVRRPDGGYNVFREVEAKEAAKNCGATAESDASLNTRQFWGQIWEQGEQ
jgi:hypothetical protein